MFTLSQLIAASLDDTLRLARLASVGGEPYLEQLWLVCQHASSEETRRAAYSALCRQGGRAEPF